MPAWPNPTKQSAASPRGFSIYGFFSVTASGASYWKKRWGWSEWEKGQSCKLPGKILMKRVTPTSSLLLLQQQNFQSLWLLKPHALRTNSWSLYSNSIADQTLPVGCLFVLGFWKNSHLWSGTDTLKISVSIYQAFTMCQALGQVLLLCTFTSHHKLPRNVASLLRRRKN